MSSFRHRVRTQILVLCGARLPIGYLCPKEVDNVDDELSHLIAYVTKGAQFDDFIAIYYSTPRDNEEDRAEAATKNAQRALKRILDHLKSSEDARKAIVKSWTDAQKNAPRSLG
jgi:hypothetical protein